MERLTSASNSVATDTEGRDSLTGKKSGSIVLNFSKDSLTGANTDNLKILQVTGQGEINVPTTITEVQLGVEVQAKTATAVQQQIAQRSTAVIDALENLGAKELQTTSIQLDPVRDNDQKLIGFEGRNVIQFEIPTTQAGKTIDEAIDAGANVIEDISFTASDEALNQARLDALREAVVDAQTEAKVVFDSLNLQPEEIVKIDISSTDVQPPVPLFASRSIAAFDATTPIIGGPQTVEASVSLDILYSGVGAPVNAGNLGL